MKLTEAQEQVIGRAVKEAFLCSPVRPPDSVVEGIMASIRDYLVKFL